MQAAPGQSRDAILTGAPTGLEGTLTFRLIDTPAGTVLIAEDTDGITENPAGTYTRTFDAPTVQGQYLIVWNNQGVEVVEELEVTASSGADPGDLATVDAVRAFLQIPDSDDNQDAEIQAFITAASRTIKTYCQREFTDRGVLERQFAYRGGGRLDLAPYDLRTATGVVFDSDGDEATLTDYLLRPTPARDGVYQWIGLPGYGSLEYGPQYPGDRSGREAVVTVTGSWGFATPPTDVAQACIITVGTWLRRDVEAFSQTFSIEEGRLERPEALPSAVRGMLAPYKRPSV